MGVGVSGWRKRSHLGVALLLLVGSVVVPSPAVASQGSEQAGSVEPAPKGDIVFVVDESGSMGGDIADVRARIGDVFDQLGDAGIDARVGVVGYARGSRVYSPLTDDRGAVVAATGMLQANHGGVEDGFRGTVTAMSDDMGFRNDAAACEVLISDEDADRRQATKADALAALRARNAGFFAVVTNSGNSEYDYGPQPASLAAETLGGTFDLLSFRADAGLVLNALIGDCIEKIETTQPLRVDAGDSQSVPEGSVARLEGTATSSLRGIEGHGGFTVDATADILAAGSDVPVPTGADPPVQVDDLVAGTMVSFAAASGSTYADPTCSGSPYPPDGAGSGTNVSSRGGVSGLLSSHRQMLVGVFVGADVPSAPSPVRLDFRGDRADFENLRPEIGQTFVIGDGQTAGGVAQRFEVPPGATRLFLGLAGQDFESVCGSYSVQVTTATGPAPVSYEWQLVSADGPPVQLSSRTSASPSFTVFDDGTYTFRLTASDGTGSASDEVTVRVGNVAPVVTSVQADPTTTDGLAEVAFTVSDPGPFDTHTVDVDWGDGSHSDGVAVGVDGTGWAYGVAGHVYGADGNHTVTVSAHDDDGGTSDPVSTSVDVGGAGTGSLDAGAGVWANASSGNRVVKVSGSYNTFGGLVHSNAGIRVTGSHHVFSGGVESVDPMSVAGSTTSVDPAASQVAAADFPYSFDAADYAPGGVAAQAAGGSYVAVDPATCTGGTWRPDQPLVSGLYWVPCDVSMTGSDVAGQVTVVASGDVHVSGSAAQLSPFVDGLLFMSTATGSRAIQLSGSDQALHGAVFAPDGGVKVSGSGDTLDCGVFASTVWVSGSHNSLGGAECAGSSGTASKVSIAAPPMLVPNLTVGLSSAESQVAPGQSAHFDASVANGVGGPGGGATMFIPVELAALASSSTPVSVDGATFTFEIHDPSTDAWSTVATSGAGGTAALSATPNPVAGVAYPSGGDRLASTTVDGHSLASWAGVATVPLDVAQTQALLDPAQVDAVRTRVVFATSGGPVRTLNRFSADPLAELRAAPGGDVSGVEVHKLAGGVDPVVDDSSVVPGLAVLHPGDTVPVSWEVAAPEVAPKGDGESDDAYVQRLGAVDGSKVFASVWATGTASPGKLYATQQLASATVALPVLKAELSAPTQVNAGDDVAWSVEVTNVGTVPAGNLDATLIVDGSAVALSGVPGTIDPGQSVTLQATSATSPGATQTLTGGLALGWTGVDGGGGTYGPVGGSATVQVRPATAMRVVKSADTTGVPAGQVGYVVEVINTGNDPLTGVVVDDPVDENTTIVAGSVSTSAGTVTTGNTPGDATVGVDVGTLGSGDSVTVQFRVDVSGVPAGVDEVVNQASVTSDQTGAVVSDDPSVPGAADPTVTTVDGGGGSGGTGGGSGGGSLPGPSLGSCTPGDGATVTAPMTFACSLSPQSGTGVDSWSVSVVPVGAPASESRSLGSGSGTDVSVALDPTVLANGQWQVTVSATGSDGGISANRVGVVVDGRLKLGRLRVSYDDMAVPVAGIPMRITRTYDTLDRLHEGDFGQGWSLGLASFRVQSGRPVGAGGWSQSQCGSVLAAAITCLSSSTDHVVSVTWPDGRVESFEFTPKQSPPAFTFMNQAVYTPLGNATSTLSPAAGDQFVMFAGTDDLFVPLSGDVYAPERFVLTGKDGTKYLLDADSGLVSATTRDGAKVTVTADGVSSSQGPSIAFDRDAAGRITKVTGPDGSTRGYGYDADGDLETYTNGRGEDQVFDYAAGHYLTQIPGGGAQPSQSFDFDADGRVSSITDSQGRITEVSFDLGARTRSVSSPGGVTTVTEVNESGDPVEQTRVGGGLSAVTSWTRDDAGRSLTVTDPDGGVTTNTYDAKGNLVSTTDPDGVVTETSYNKFAEPVDTAVGGTVTVHRAYDDLGRLVSEGRPGEPATTYGWSGAKVTSIIKPSGAQTTVGYDANGFVSAINSAAGTVGRVNDPAGRVVGMVSPGNVHTGFQYDGDGNLTGLVDDGNRSQSWSYDSAGRVKAASDKFGRTTSYTYTSSGELVSRSDRNGATTTYGYDGAGLVDSVSGPDGTTTINRDGLGRPVTIANQTATVTLGWSLGGKLTSESTDYGVSGVADQVVDYTTSSTGRVTGVTGQGSITTYGYDSQGRLTTVDDSVAGNFGFAYDNATGNLASMSRPNGINDEYGFDVDGRLTSRVAKDSSGTVIDQADYTYNMAGLRDSLTDLAGVHDYTYDADGRLTGVDNPAAGLADEAFFYDNLGNLTSWPGNPASEVQHNQADQLTQDASNTYTYDAEGNLTQVKDRATGDITGYTWDTAHQLTKITRPDGTTDSYGYGPLGRRLTATNSLTGTKVFVWAGANLRATLDGTGNLITRNVSTQQLNGTLAVTTPTGTIYPLKDGLGSTTATTNSAGTVTSTTAYSAYGTPTTTDDDSGVGQIAGYTGHQTNPGGLLYARARHYNPRTGRFLSEDPVTSVNRYAYTSGDPINYTDPSGEIEILENSVAHRFIVARLYGALNGLLSSGLQAIITCGGSTSCQQRAVLSGVALGTLGGGAFVRSGLAGRQFAGCIFGGLAQVIEGAGVAFASRSSAGSFLRESGSAGSAFAVGCAFGTAGSYL